MGDERRWAARYQFLEELWRERDRIVFDPELEQVLVAGSAGWADELVGRLLPDAEPDARVWMPLGNERRAGRFRASSIGHRVRRPRPPRPRSRTNKTWAGPA